MRGLAAVRTPRNALRSRLSPPHDGAVEVGARRAKLEIERIERAERKRRALERAHERLPALIWRSPYFPLFQDVPTKEPRSPKKAPPFGNPSMFKSQKMGGRYIVCTAQPELHLAYQCEFDDSVAAYVEQPFAIRYRCIDYVALHVPDMFVMRSGRPVVIQAKTVVGAATAEWRSREPFIRAALEELGFSYELRTSAELSVQPRLRNIRRRIDDRLRSLPDGVQRAQCHLQTTGPQPLWAVSDAIGATLVDLRIMVAHRFLCADVDAEFDEDIVLKC